MTEWQSSNRLLEISLYSNILLGMIKYQIISWKITDKVLWIIPQHVGEYFFISSESLAYLFGLRVIIQLIEWLVWTKISGIIWWVGWIIIFGIYVYRFMQIYLDAIVLTNRWIVILDQQWIINYNQSIFERDAIQTISYSQHWIVDYILNRWDVIVGLEHWQDYIISSAYQPWKRSQRLLNYHHQYQTPLITPAMVQSAQEENSNPEKFDILVDTLSEIITDYMKQKS